MTRSFVVASFATIPIIRKGVPVPVLRQKAEEFIEARLITDTLADQIIQTIEQMRGASRLINEVGDGEAGAQEPGDGAAPDRAGVRLSRDQLFKELASCNDLSKRLGNP